MRYALTTKDNPYDPLNDFVSWFIYDETKGYHTCSLLGRVAKTSTMLTEKENDEEIERAIDSIILNDFQGIYRKCSQSTSFAMT